MPEWMHVLSTLVTLTAAGSWLGWRWWSARRRPPGGSCGRCGAARTGGAVPMSGRRSPQLRILG